MIKETILNRSDTHSGSLKTTVPKEITSRYNLKKGSIIEWDEITLLEGTILNGNHKRKVKEPEHLIIIRVKEK